jgi:hypothetical protein
VVWLEEEREEKDEEEKDDREEKEWLGIDEECEVVDNDAKVEDEADAREEGREYVDDEEDVPKRDVVVVERVLEIG